MSSISDLSVKQLRQAADLKEKIEGLQKELSQLVGSTAGPVVTPVTAKAPKKKAGMSAAGKAKVAAAQRARWAKINAAKASAESATPAKTVVAVKPAVKAVVATKPAKKSGMDAAAKAKLSIAMKAAWAARKAAKK